VFELPRWVFSSNDRFFELFVMHRRIILRNHWSYWCDGYMRCGIILSHFINCLFELFIRKFSIFNGIIFMHILHCRVILRRDWTDYSDRILCSRHVFNRLFDQLFELSCGDVSGLDGINNLYGLSRRIILRNHRSLSSDGKLPFGILFSSLRNDVFKLSHWFLPSNGRLITLLGMSRRVVLRHHRFNNSDGSLFSGLILGSVFNCVLELLSGIMLFVSNDSELLRVCCRFISGRDGIYTLHAMPWRIILHNSWSHSSDGKLLFGILF